MASFMKFLREMHEVRTLPGNATLDEVWDVSFMKEMTVMATYMIDHVLRCRMTPADRRAMTIGMRVQANSSLRILTFTNIPDDLEPHEHKLNSECVNALRKASKYLGIATTSAAMSMARDPNLSIVLTWKGPTEGKLGEYFVTFSEGSPMVNSICRGEPLAKWRVERADTKNADAPRQ